MACPSWNWENRYDWKLDIDIGNPTPEASVTLVRLQESGS